MGSKIDIDPRVFINPEILSSSEEPAPDAAIHRITQIIYGLGTLPSADFVKGKTKLWRPYRSIATMYLYQASKLKVSAADIRGGRAQRDEASIRSGT